LKLLSLVPILFSLNASALVTNIVDYTPSSNTKRYIVISNYSNDIVNFIANATEFSLKSNSHIKLDCIYSSDVFINNDMISVPCNHKLELKND